MVKKNILKKIFNSINVYQTPNVYQAAGSVLGTQKISGTKVKVQ